MPAHPSGKAVNSLCSVTSFQMLASVKTKTIYPELKTCESRDRGKFGYLFCGSEPVGLRRGSKFDNSATATPGRDGS